MEIKNFNLDVNKPWLTLTAYIGQKVIEVPYSFKRKAILIIPGGGYQFISVREGEPIAYEFLANGYNCFVLNY